MSGSILAFTSYNRCRNRFAFRLLIADGMRRSGFGNHHHANTDSHAYAQPWSHFQPNPHADSNANAYADSDRPVDQPCDLHDAGKPRFR